MKRKIILAIPVLYKFRAKKIKTVKEYIRIHFSNLYKYLPPTEEMIFKTTNLEYWYNHCFRAYIKA